MGKIEITFAEAKDLEGIKDVLREFKILEKTEFRQQDEQDMQTSHVKNTLLNHHLVVCSLRFRSNFQKISAGGQVFNRNRQINRIPFNGSRPEYFTESVHKTQCP